MKRGIYLKKRVLYSDKGRHLSYFSDIMISMEAISAVYTASGIIVPAVNEANSLYQDGYGSQLKERRVLSLEPVEALYLVERQKVSVIVEETKDRLFFRELLLRFSKVDPGIWNRYIVYRDLRTRGFVVKSGISSNIDFLVYERGSYGKKVPRYMIHAIWEGASEPMERLSELLNEAKKTDKILRLAVVDRRGEIVYYTLADMDFENS